MHRVNHIKQIPVHPCTFLPIIQKRAQQKGDRPHIFHAALRYAHENEQDGGRRETHGLIILQQIQMQDQQHAVHAVVALQELRSHKRR